MNVKNKRNYGNYNIKNINLQNYLRIYEYQWYNSATFLVIFSKMRQFSPLDNFIRQVLKMRVLEQSLPKYSQIHT